MEPYLSRELRGVLLSPEGVLEKLREQIGNAERTGGNLVAVQIGLEGLNRLGRSSGEDRLKRIAEGVVRRILSCLPAQAIVGLYSGWTLLVILPGMQLEQVRALAARTLDRLAESVGRLPITVRLAAYPQDGRTAEEILEMLQAGIDSLALSEEPA